MKDYLITIEIEGIPAEVAAIVADLREESSGFRIIDEPIDYDLRCELNSCLGDIVTVVGVVISAAQLMLSLKDRRGQAFRRDHGSDLEKDTKIIVVTHDVRIPITSENNVDVQRDLEMYEVRNGK
jgi:hypothetical protein